MADLNQANNFLKDAPLSSRVNPAADGSADVAQASKTALETIFGFTGANIVSRIITYTGTYLHVKFLVNGKKFGQYKSRNYSAQDEVLTAREYQSANGSPATSVVSSLAVTGTNTGAALSTSQFTATITRADTTTADISPKATWSSATPAHATVSSTGLVTAVATGASVITATFAGVSNTRTFTTS